MCIRDRFGAALHVLEDPLIGAIIAENKVAWNDVDLDTVPNNGSGALFSVVINKKCKFTAIYESGPDYIRIASITGKTDDSIINPRYFIIEVDEYGAISCPSMVADEDVYKRQPLWTTQKVMAGISATLSMTGSLRRGWRSASW